MKKYLTKIRVALMMMLLYDGSRMGMNNSHAHQFILYIYQDQDLSSSQETSGTTNAKSPEHISFTDDSPCIYPYTKYQAQRPFPTTIPPIPRIKQASSARPRSLTPSSSLP